MWTFPGYPLTMFLVPIAILAMIYFGSQSLKNKPSDIKLVIANFIVIYLLVVVSVFIYDFYLEYKVSTFDLDGDGFFSNRESTPEYLEYSSRLTNDVGRNFAPITGFVFAFLWTAFFYLLLKVIRFIKRSTTTTQ